MPIWVLIAAKNRNNNTQTQILLCFCSELYRFNQLPMYEIKSVNLKYNKLVCWADGTNDSSSKRLMFQALFFFHKILQNSLQKPFQSIFYKITKMKIKSFECLYEILKKKILGTSNAWSTSRLSHRPSKPAYYIVDCRISRVE